MKGKMNSRLGLGSIVLICLIMILSFSCHKQTTRWQGTIEEIDGVTVVKNPGEPIYREGEFWPEEELMIGKHGEDAGQFQLISYLAVDNEENIYVPDTKACHVRVFDKNGNPVKTIGRKGEGPGELMFPSGIQITARGEIVVQSRAFLHLFSLQGEFLRRLNAASMRQPIINSKGHIIACERINLDSPDEQKFDLKIFDSGLRPMMTLATCSMETRMPKVHYWEMRWNYNPIVWGLIKEDHIVWGDRRKYEFSVLSSEGKLVRKISVAHKQKEMTKADKERLLNEWFDGNPPPSEYTFIFPAHFPAFANFSCAEDGSFLVQTYEETEDGKKTIHDIFDSAGRFLARVPLRTRNFVLKKGKLYTIEEDQDGYYSVKRYRFAQS
jgi:hypothetical protein